MNRNLDDVIEYYSKIAETLRKQVRIEDNDYMDKVDEVYTCEQLAEWLNELKLLRERIDAQPEQRWIPVGERLPEVHESGNSFSGIYMQSVPVLVYGICEGEKNAQFHVVTYCDDLDGTTYWSTELDAFTITKVTAWMPLPEPYKPPTRSQYRRMQEQKGEQE